MQMSELELEEFCGGTESELAPQGLQKMLLDIGKNATKDDAACHGEAGSMQRMAARIVNNPTFERANGMVIAANSLFIAVQMNVTEENLRENAAEGFSEGWRYADYCFTVVFIVELMLRMVAERKLFFTGHSKKWNMFDLGMVVLAIAEECLSLVPSSGLVHILRFLRFVRLACFVRFFREERMFWGRIHSITFMVWAILLVMMLVFLILCYLTERLDTVLAGDVLDQLEIVPPAQFSRPQYV